MLILLHVLYSLTCFKIHKCVVIRPVFDDIWEDIKLAPTGCPSLYFLLFHLLVPFWATLNNSRCPLTFQRLADYGFFLSAPLIQTVPNWVSFIWPQKWFHFHWWMIIYFQLIAHWLNGRVQKSVMSLLLATCQDQQDYFLLFKHVVSLCLFTADLICTYTS